MFVGGDAGRLAASQAINDGVVFYHPTAVQLESVRRVLISKGDCYVLATEEGCAVLCGDSANVGVLVGEVDDVVH